MVKRDQRDIMEDLDRHLTDRDPKIDCVQYLKMHANNYKYLPNLFTDNTVYRSSRAGWPQDMSPPNQDVTFKTQAELDQEAMERKEMVPQVFIEIKGPHKWTYEESVRYLEEKQKNTGKAKESMHVGDKSKRERERKRCDRKSLEEIYHADMMRKGWRVVK